MRRTNSRHHTAPQLFLIAVALFAVVTPTTRSVRAQGIGQQQQQTTDAVGRSAPLTVLDSNRAQDGLVGPVRRVRVETAKMSYKSGQPIEGPHVLLQATTYDLQGNRTANTSYPVAAEARGLKEEYKYDDAGHAIERLQRDADGTPRSREIYTYEYDAIGNWTKRMTLLMVIEGGKVTYEPVEITYRVIAYYFNDQIAKLAQLPKPLATPLANVTDVAKTKPQLDLTATSSSTNAPQQLAVEKSPVTASEAPTQHGAIPAQETRQQPAGALVAASQAASERSEIDIGNEPQAVSAPTPPPESLTGSLLNDKALELPEPVYPTGAAFAHVAGQVDVGVVIDEKGQVSAAHVISGHPLLNDAAIAAARRARFAPTLHAGQPVKVAGVIRYKFTFAQGATGAQVSFPVNDLTPPAAMSSPKEAAASYKIGLTHYESGRYREAIEAFNQSIRFDPGNAETYNDLGLAYSKLKLYDDSIAAFKQALRLKSNFAVAYFNLGVVFGELDQQEAAIKAYKEAIRLEPEDADAHYNLGVIQLKRGARKAALSEYATLQTLGSPLATELYKLINK